MEDLRLVPGLRQSLLELPHLVLERIDEEVTNGGMHVDGIAHVRIRERPVRIIIERKSSGYPRVVKPAIEQIISVIGRLQPADPGIAIAPMFIAPHISKASRDLLIANQIGYWDESGSLYLEVPWAHYWLNQPPKERQQRALQSVFRGSTAQVLHALLVDWPREWQIGELAERAQVSPSTAHQACEYLESQLWLEKSGSGPRTVRRLVDPGSLLDAWRDAHDLAEYEHRHYFRWDQRVEATTRKVTEAIAQLGIPYALTLSSGAERVAPYATDTSKIQFLLPSFALGSLDEIAKSAGIKPVENGENITLLFCRDRSPLLFTKTVDGLSIASDVQLYLDLFAWPKRGREQAQHLREIRLTY